MQAAFAALYDGFAAAIVPVNAPKHFIVLAAKDKLGEAVVTAVAALASIGAGMNHSPAYQFFLHLHEDFLCYNRFMVAFHIVLRDSTVVLDSGFAEEVGGVGLLQQGITNVFFVPQNLVDGTRPLFGLPSAGESAVSHKTGGNPVHTVAFHVLLLDPLERFGLLRIDDKVTICILGVHCIDGFLFKVNGDIFIL